MNKFIFISAFTNIVSPNNRISAIINRIEGEKLVLTTDYNHTKKAYYRYGEAEHYQQVLLHVPAYTKNISLKRIWSHLVFAWKVRCFLRGMEEYPTAIYCSMPSSSSAYICARYCKKHRVKFIIDVIDLWPDSLIPLVKYKEFLRVILYPWTLLTRYAYRTADVIVGESIKYVQVAKKYNNDALVYPIYLGIDVPIVQNVINNNPIKLKKAEGEIWIAYAGSLGESYDFKYLLEAIKGIHGKYRYKLWFIGDGVKRAEIYDFIHSNNLNAEITGFLSYEKLLGYLLHCDIAINIFRRDTKVVFSYKFNDYVASRCFVLNSLEGETADLVDKYKVGRNFNFSTNTLLDVLEDTMCNWNKYSLWKNNFDLLIKEKLDKDIIYSVVKEFFV